MLGDLGFAASFSEWLIARPRALRELLEDEQVRQRLFEDPVFFAVLMCNDKWLVDAPDHQRLLRDMSPRQVAVCGRGWGKSLVFSRKNLWLVFTRPKVECLIISSTQRQSMIMFDYCFHTVQSNPIMKRVFMHPGTTRTTIRLKQPMGGRLVALPCSPDKLRGFHPDWVFCDEASIVPSGMITSEILPMLTKPDCHFVMSGTPKGFDHILHDAFFDRARYSVHHYGSFSSPLVSKERLADWKLDMTEEEWTREVEAEWTELTNVFFPMDLIMSCVDSELGDPNSGVRFFDDLETVKKSMLEGSFYAGLDVGKQMDPSVLIVVQKIGDKRRLVYKHQFPLKTPYPDVIGHVVRANQIFDFVSICVDKTGVGDVIVDELEHVDLSNVKGLVFSDRWKQEILTYLKLLMEQRMLGFLPDDAALISQMNEQQFEYTQPKTAREHVYMKFLASAA